MNYLNYHKLRYKNVSTCCHSSIYFVNLVQAKGYCFRYKKIVSLNNLHSWIIRIKRNLRKEDNAQCIWLIDYPWISNMAIARFETLLKRAPRQWIVSENQPVINHFAAIKLNNITWALLLKNLKTCISDYLYFAIHHRPLFYAKKPLPRFQLCNAATEGGYFAESRESKSSFSKTVMIGRLPFKCSFPRSHILRLRTSCYYLAH